MATYTITLSDEQDAGLELIRLQTEHETKDALVESMITGRAEARLREEYKATIVQEKDLSDIKTELDAQ